MGVAIPSALEDRQAAGFTRIAARARQWHGATPSNPGQFLKKKIPYRF